MHPLVLVGGGLANALIAYRLAECRPELKVLVLERGSSLGGNHTWSFHHADLSPEQHQWIGPLVDVRWPGYDVRFPGFSRCLDTPYYSITSARLAAHVGTRLGAGSRLNTEVRRLSPDSVTLASGESIPAAAVIDGRGDSIRLALTLGFQKFLGLEVRLSAPHGLAKPVLMDATVPQLDGYRFLYTLPLAADRLLIEDTRYSDVPGIDSADYRLEIQAYARSQGWQIERIEREERGVLPVALGGDPMRHWQADDAIGRAGLSAGLFHPTTGYTLAEAVRLADAIASLRTIDAQAVHALTRRSAAAHWHAGGFFRLLNRMLFRAAAPTERYRVLRRFYGLPAGLIERFYAGRPTSLDKVRILAGRPPVPILAALKCIRESPPWVHPEHGAAP